MAARPTVSVVIPTYNRADLVLRAVASVRRQSLEDWEMIVVDDASTDDTKTRIDALRDTRVARVRRDVNGGVSAAQNTGLDHATGRYVMFLHSDDELLPDSLRCLSDALDRATPATGGIEGGLEVIERTATTRRPPFLEGADARALLGYRSGVHISSLMLRREVASEVRFDEALRGVEDRDFCIRLLRRSKLGFVSEAVVRLHRTAPRLTEQSKGPMYEYLLDKYRDEIVSSPSVHGTWWFRIAREYARSGEPARARAAMHRSTSVDPSRVRRWPLFAATYLGDRAFSSALRAYRVGARIIGSRHPA